MRFAIIGAAGYIAPRHMQAIVETGHEIALACDTRDSVGVLDRWAPECTFVRDTKLFFEICRESEYPPIDAVVICTPNYMHVTHACQAMAAGCDVVLEKPLCVPGENDPDVGDLIKSAAEHGRIVYPVVQLRHHREASLPVIGSRHRSVEIDYAVWRGPWYDCSWKADRNRSGGLLLNLGVHLFDLCNHLFGDLVEVCEAFGNDYQAQGVNRHQRATVTWRLRRDSRTPRRVFRIDGYEIDMTTAITKLHHAVYREVAQGHFWDLEDVARSIDVVKAIEEAMR